MWYVVCGMCVCVFVDLISEIFHRLQYVLSFLTSCFAKLYAIFKVLDISRFFFCEEDAFKQGH
jgi:hypothetical protein